MIILGVLVGADATLEATFHERFKHIRLHGEWFRANEELLDFVDLLMALQDAIALAGTLRAVGGR